MPGYAPQRHRDECVVMPNHMQINTSSATTGPWRPSGGTSPKTPRAGTWTNTDRSGKPFLHCKPVKLFAGKAVTGRHLPYGLLEGEAFGPKGLDLGQGLLRGDLRDR